MEKVNDSPSNSDETKVSPPKEEVVVKEEESEEDKKGDPSDEDKSTEEKEPEEFFSQIGNHKFKTKEELEEFAKKEYGEHSRLLGEVNHKANKEAKEVVVEKPSVQEGDNKDVKPESNSLRRVLQLKSDIFFFDNPEAEPHRELIASILQTGKAVNDKGLPDFDRAWEKAKLILGDEVPIASKENSSTTKKMLKTGGSSGSSAGNPAGNDANKQPSNSPFLQSIWRRKGI